MNPLTLIAFCLHTVHVYAGPYSTEGLSIRDAGKVIQSRWAHGDLFKRKICCSVCRYTIRSSIPFRIPDDCSASLVAVPKAAPQTTSTIIQYILSCENTEISSYSFYKELDEAEFPGDKHEE